MNLGRYFVSAQRVTGKQQGELWFTRILQPVLDSNGKQVNVKRPSMIEGIDADAYIQPNADPNLAASPNCLTSR